MSAASANTSPPEKRIALFTGNYNHVTDGVSLTLNRLVAYLEQQDIDVLVFGPTVEDPPIQHAGELISVPSIAMPGRPEYRISTALPKDVRRKLRAFKPNLIHIATPDVLGFWALQYAQKHKIPVVASYHTHFGSYLKYYGMHLLEGGLWRYLKWFYSHCRHIYVPSESMAEVLRSHGISNGLKQWERGVDVTRFNPGCRSLEWRRSLGIADDEVVVTFVSRLVWEKGLDVYADVIEGLQQKGIPHRRVIVGDGPVREELEDRLSDTIFTGHLTGDELAQAYASCDVFLFPSETETFGNVTLEAMASGLPTVCADATGSRGLVRHEGTGFLAPSGDRETFLDYTARLVQDHDLRSKMGRAALAESAHYAWGLVLARIVKYYNEILQG
jgi:glycosyltransferase involved in cell wall biosynthesis